MTAGGPYFLGIDGGATRCRARLRDAAGAMRAQTTGPAANIYVDYPSALAVVRAVIKETLDKAGLRLDGSASVSLGLGLAGISTGADAARIVADLSAQNGIASVHAANDAVIACLGAHAGADGGLIVAGTGSIGVARLGGRDIVIGGRGFLLGDDGSAAANVQGLVVPERDFSRRAQRREKKFQRVAAGGMRGFIKET